MASKYNIDIIGIQEHRLTLPSETTIYCEHIKETDYIFSYISAEKGNGGVGFIFKTIYLNRIQNIQKISPRIMSITLNANPNITILSIYSPTNIADENKIKEFYNILDDYIKTVSIHNIILIIGDFNARIGRDSYSRNETKYIGSHTYSDQTNKNGIHLRDLCLSNNLIHLPSRFPHKPNHQWTWQHPKGPKAQIDHILCCNKWKNSIKDCRAQTISFKLSLRSNRKVQNKISYDWTFFNNNKKLQDEYANAITNKFAILEELGDKEIIDIQEKYSTIINVIEETNKIIPKKK
jgi:exonuclease III